MSFENPKAFDVSSVSLELLWRGTGGSACATPNLKKSIRRLQNMIFAAVMTIRWP